MWHRTSTIKRLNSPLARIGLGFALVALAQFLALLLSGAGHGWVAPFFLSFSLWFLIPLTFAVAWPTSPAEKPVLLVMTAIAVFADALLAFGTVDELSTIGSLVDVNGTLGLIVIGLWLALWFCWQVILLYSLVARHDDA